MIELDPAWVLHTRDYRETSLLVDLFGLRTGRCRVVAKGARRGKRSQRAVLQPFRPLLFSAVGRGELRTLTAVEDSGPVVPLAGMALACGLYLNELVLALLPAGDASPEVFAQYGTSIATIAAGEPAGPALRIFELTVLLHLGLAPAFDVTAGTAQPIEAERDYGLYRDGIEPASDQPAACVVSGAALLALAQRDFSVHRAEQRKLLAALLQEPLGHRELRSRALLQEFRALAAQPGLQRDQPPPEASEQQGHG
ncbi:MAG: DNA repair protein RecO [Pseudomonadota bacterium]